MITATIIILVVLAVLIIATVHAYLTHENQ